MLRTWNARRWIALAMLAVVIASVSVWALTRERLPGEIRIATAVRGGLYQRFATLLAQRIEARTGIRVELVETRGSLDNHGLLTAGEVDLAVLQASSVPMDDVAVLAPLYPEVVHVVVREDSAVRDVGGLVGARVSLGPEGSGMRSSASGVLGHYGIAPEDLAENERYFGDLTDETALDAAIVTTGLGNPDLHALLHGGGLRLVPIEDALAISILNPLFEPFVIPRGLFGESPAIPSEDVRTLASTAILAADRDVSGLLAGVALEALYEPDMRLQIPMLVPMQEAVESAPAPLHSSARSYLNPYEGLTTFSSLIESLSGIKELIFGAAALVYLLWDVSRRSRERERERLLSDQKEHLDGFLERTVSIERAQMETADIDALRRYQDELTRIKIQAIEELTHEDLRGDRMFLIFLIQCSNLNHKLENRIAAASS